MQLLTLELLHWESAKYANILLIQEVISAAEVVEERAISCK